MRTNDRTKAYELGDKEGIGTETDHEIDMVEREGTDRVRATTWKLGQWIDIGEQQVFALEDMR